jgi:hypothetical protein
VAASRQSRGDDEAIGRQLGRYPACTNVLALTRWWWATSELRMSMRPLTISSRRPVTLSPYLYGLYSPPKQRWWPLFAYLGAGGVCVLALLGPSQQPDGARSTQRPLVYSVIRPDVLVTAKPAVKEPAPAAAILNEPADDPPAASAAAAPTRTKTRHSSTKHRASAQRYAARKSHRQEVLNYGRYGYSWGRYF